MMKHSRDPKGLDRVAYIWEYTFSDGSTITQTERDALPEQEQFPSYSPPRAVTQARLLPQEDGLPLITARIPAGCLPCYSRQVEIARLGTGHLGKVIYKIGWNKDGIRYMTGIDLETKEVMQIIDDGGVTSED